MIYQFKIKVVHVLWVSLLVSLACIYFIYTSKPSLNDSSATLDVIGQDEITNGFKIIKEDKNNLEPQKDLLVLFVNNVYSLDSTYNLKLIMNNTYIVYDGKFSQFLNLKIPLSKIEVDRNTEVGFILSKKACSYRFRTMQTCKFEKSNNILEIVFTPKGNDYFMFYFTFIDSDKHTF